MNSEREIIEVDLRTGAQSLRVVEHPHIDSAINDAFPENTPLFAIARVIFDGEGGCRSDDQIVIPVGSFLIGQVDHVRKPGRLKGKGEVVLSRLDSKTLIEMAQKAGWFLPAGTDNFDLVETFEETIGREEGREVYEEHMSWTEIFQPFLLAGLFFYLLSVATAERPNRQESIEIGEAVGA